MQIGVSQFAVDELTDVTFVEVGVADGRISAGQAFGEIESVKATSDLICGIDGEVTEVNQNVLDNPAADQRRRVRGVADPGQARR